MTRPLAVELRGVSKSYGAARVLDDVSLAVEPGEIFGYLGANGAGKTTTIKMCMGIERPTAGALFVAGLDVLADPLEAKARVGYVPESGAVFERLSPREYLTAVCDLYRVEPATVASRVDGWLSRFSLADRADDRMDVFSKGMRQKVCIAAALVHEPDVVFLDEPLNGLDAESVVIVKDLMRELAAGGTTLFYTSHLVDVVEKICTRVGVLRGGRLVGLGTVEEVRALRGSSSLEAALMELWKEPA